MAFTGSLLPTAVVATYAEPVAERAVVSLPLLLVKTDVKFTFTATGSPTNVTYTAIAVPATSGVTFEAFTVGTNTGGTFVLTLHRVRTSQANLGQSITFSAAVGAGAPPTTVTNFTVARVVGTNSPNGPIALGGAISLVEASGPELTISPALGSVDNTRVGFYVSLRNNPTSPATLYSSTIVVPVPGGVSVTATPLVSSTNATGFASNYSAGQLTITLPTLPAGRGTTFLVVYTVAASWTTGSFAVTGVGRSWPSGLAKAYSTGSATVTVAKPTFTPSLTFTQTVIDVNASANQVTCRYVLTNPSVLTAVTAVPLQMVYPTGTITAAYTSSPADAFSINGLGASTLSGTLRTTLAPTTTVTLDIVIALTVPLSNMTALNTSLTVGTNPTITTDNLYYIMPQPSLVLNKTSANTSTWRIITYALTVHNNGTLALTNIPISDALPAGVTAFTGINPNKGTFVPSSTYENGGVLGVIPSLTAGASLTINYNANVSYALVKSMNSLSNSASAPYSPNGIALRATTTYMSPVLIPVLAVDKYNLLPQSNDNIIYYQIKVRNTGGASTLVPVVVADTADSRLSALTLIPNLSYLPAGCALTTTGGSFPMTISPALPPYSSAVIGLSAIYTRTASTADIVNTTMVSTPTDTTIDSVTDSDRIPLNQIPGRGRVPIVSVDLVNLTMNRGASQYGGLRGGIGDRMQYTYNFGTRSTNGFTLLSIVHTWTNSDLERMVPLVPEGSVFNFPLTGNMTAEGNADQASARVNYSTVESPTTKPNVVTLTMLHPVTVWGQATDQGHSDSDGNAGRETVGLTILAIPFPFRLVDQNDNQTGLNLLPTVRFNYYEPTDRETAKPYANLCSSRLHVSPYFLIIEPTLSISKIITSSNLLAPGQGISYQVTVTNSGTAPAYQVVIDDEDITVADNFSTYRTTNVAPGWNQVTSQPLRFTIDQLGVGANATFAFNGTLKSDLVDGTIVRNLAQVTARSLPADNSDATYGRSGTDGSGATPPNVLTLLNDYYAQSHVTSRIMTPRLNKIVSPSLPGPYRPGNFIVFDIIVTRPIGTSTVLLTETPSVGLMLQGAGPAAPRVITTAAASSGLLPHNLAGGSSVALTNINGNTFTLAVTIANNATTTTNSFVLRLTYLVAATYNTTITPVPPALPFTTITTVSNVTNTVSDGTRTAYVGPVPIANPCLAVRKSHVLPVCGPTLHYQIIIEHSYNSSGDAFAINLADSIVPNAGTYSNLAVVYTHDDRNNNGTPIPLSNGSLPNSLVLPRLPLGASALISYDYTPSLGTTQLTNTVTVNYATTDPMSANPLPTKTITARDIALIPDPGAVVPYVIQTGPSSVYPIDSVDYIITVGYEPRAEADWTSAILDNTITHGTLVSAVASYEPPFQEPTTLVAVSGPQPATTATSFSLNLATANFVVCRGRRVVIHAVCTPAGPSPLTSTAVLTYAPVPSGSPTTIVAAANTLINPTATGAVVPYLTKRSPATITGGTSITYELDVGYEATTQSDWDRATLSDTMATAGVTLLDVAVTYEPPFQYPDLTPALGPLPNFAVGDSTFTLALDTLTHNRRAHVCATYAVAETVSGPVRNDALLSYSPGTPASITVSRTTPVTLLPQFVIPYLVNSSPDNYRGGSTGVFELMAGYEPSSTTNWTSAVLRNILPDVLTYVRATARYEPPFQNNDLSPAAGPQPSDSGNGFTLDLASTEQPLSRGRLVRVRVLFTTPVNASGSVTTASTLTYSPANSPASGTVTASTTLLINPATSVAAVLISTTTRIPAQAVVPHGTVFQYTIIVAHDPILSHGAATVTDFVNTLTDVNTGALTSLVVTYHNMPSAHIALVNNTIMAPAAFSVPWGGSFTITYSITPVAIASALSTITTTTYCPQPDTPSITLRVRDDVAIAPRPPIEVFITKTRTTTPVLYGEPIHYILKLGTYPGSSPASEVVVVDTRSQGDLLANSFVVTYFPPLVESTGVVTPSSGLLMTFTLPVLPVGTIAIVEYDIIVPAPSPGSATGSNRAQAQWFSYPETSPRVANSTTDNYTITVLSAAAYLFKERLTDPVCVGRPIKYRLTLGHDNASSGAVTQFTLTDTPSQGTISNVVTQAPPSVIMSPILSNGGLLIPPFSLPRCTTALVTYDVTLPVNPTTAGGNDVTWAYAPNPLAPAVSQTPLRNTYRIIEPLARLYLSKVRTTDPVILGAPIMYTVVIGHIDADTGPAYNLELIDVTSQGTFETYSAAYLPEVADPVQPVLTESVLSYTLPQLDKGTVVTITYHVNLPPDPILYGRNDATLKYAAERDAGTTTTISDQDQYVITPSQQPRAELYVTKVLFNNPVQAGVPLNYKIKIGHTPNSQATARAVAFSDVWGIDQGTLLHLSAPLFNDNNGLPIHGPICHPHGFSCTLAELPNFYSMTLYYSFQPAATVFSGSNTAKVSYMISPFSTTTDRVSTTVKYNIAPPLPAAPACLYVHKEYTSPHKPCWGVPLPFRATIAHTHTSGQAATHLIINDTSSQGALTNIRARYSDAYLPAFDPSSFGFTVPTLPVGVTLVVTYELTLDNPTATTVHNTTAVTYNDGEAGPDSVCSRVEPQIELSTSRTVASAAIAPPGSSLAGFALSPQLGATQETSDTVTLTLTPALLTISKRALPASVGRGDVLTWVFTYANSGTLPLLDVVVVEPLLPAWMAFAPEFSDPGWESTGVGQCWNVPIVPPLGNGTLIYAAHVTGPFPPGLRSFVNEATVVVGKDDPRSVRAPVLVRAREDIRVRKSITAGAVIPGQLITYTLRVINEGDVMPGDLRVVDNVPSGTTYIESPGWTVAAGVLTYLLPTGNVPLPGTQVSLPPLSFRISSALLAAVINTASVYGPEGELLDTVTVRDTLTPLNISPSAPTGCAPAPRYC